ncbi:hypothetical protein [Aminobacter sp. HY435]|uniref:hypothetical protein n=1 Tax=Aminobacter sp. HY435 TaxID=2970917 RepID=UPI0022B979F4|nr:hypothetical protein [Aminobacter sp. HY435]
MRQVAVQANVGAVSVVASSATLVTLLAANRNRLGAVITNDSTAVLTIKLGVGASQSDYTVKLAPSATGVPASYELPFGYVGVVTGLWASANGDAKVTELS